MTGHAGAWWAQVVHHPTGNDTRYHFELWQGCTYRGACAWIDARRADPSIEVTEMMIWRAKE